MRGLPLYDVLLMTNGHWTGSWQGLKMEGLGVGLGRRRFTYESKGARRSAIGSCTIASKFMIVYIHHNCSVIELVRDRIGL